jgi:hypothetical protein
VIKLAVLAVLALVSYAAADAPAVKKGRKGAGKSDFASWREVFEGIAASEGIDPTPDNLVELAVDSKVEHLGDGELILVSPNFTDYSLRGASGNGSILLFKKTAKGYHLVGAMLGNSCEPLGSFSENGKPVKQRFRTTWHVSSRAYTETIYETDGATMTQLESKEIVEKADAH